MRLLKISSKMTGMSTEQLVEMARLNPQLGIPAVVNFAKSSLPPNRQVDLAVAMSYVRGLPEDSKTRMFIYDVASKTPSTPALRKAIDNAIKHGNFSSQEATKLDQVAAADAKNAALIFMEKNSPAQTTQRIADRFKINSAKDHMDIASRNHLLAKMKEMQDEGFAWDGNLSGGMVAREIETDSSVEKFVFKNFNSFPDYIAGVVLGDVGKNSFGRWRNNNEYKAIVAEAKKNEIKTANLLLTYLRNWFMPKGNIEAALNLIETYFHDNEVSFEEKQKAYDWAVQADGEIRTAIKKTFSEMPDERVYNHMVDNFLAGNDDDMVRILTSSLEKALTRSKEIYDRIKKNPRLEAEANPIFLAIVKALEDDGTKTEEPFDSNDTLANWFDTARIKCEAGMLDNISKETKKNLLIGYLLFISGLPLWVWAAKSGTSEREMRSHPEMKQKAEGIYSTSNEQMRQELDRLKEQIQREIEERQRKALEAPSKRPPTRQATDFSKCEVTPELVQTIISMEHDPSKNTSSAGAAGVMQLMKPTWDELNRKHFGGKYPWHKYRFNKDVNIRFGTQYLKNIKAFLDDHQNEWKADQHSLIMACYFGGIGNVQDAHFDPHVMKRKLPLTYDYMTRGTNLMERDSETLLPYQKNGATSIEPVAPLSYARL
jgi:hypothetical protein